MFKLLTKYLDTNEKELSRYKTIVEKINSLESETKKLKDEDFPARTAAFKDRIEKGETLENILPEAFADQSLQTYPKNGSSVQ